MKVERNDSKLTFFVKEEDDYYLPGTEITLIDYLYDTADGEPVGLFEGVRKLDGALSQEINAYSDFIIYKDRGDIIYKCCGNRRGDGHKNECKNNGFF